MQRANAAVRKGATVSDEPITQDLFVRTCIAAPRDAVWQFLSDGQRFAGWIGAFAGGPPLPETEVEPRLGGRLSVAFPDSQIARGQILEMQPPVRIAFTWGYDDGAHGMHPGSTRVEISLEESPEGTLVQLRHSGIAADEARRDHRAGWIHYVSMLARQALAAHHEEKLPGLIEAWFAAWAEPDDEARLAILNRCCDPAVRLRTSFAHTDGVEELNEHIRNAQRHMPGVRMRPCGAPQHVRGNARVDWVVEGPDGTDAFRGMNIMTLSPDSRFLSVVAFSVSQPS